MSNETEIQLGISLALSAFVTVGVSSRNEKDMVDVKRAAMLAFGELLQNSDYDLGLLDKFQIVEIRDTDDMLIVRLDD